MTRTPRTPGAARARDASVAAQAPCPDDPAGQPPDARHFEQALRELEQLVERLEQGDLPLEESLRVFERGIHLTRTCQRALDDAEQKVRILTTPSAEPEIYRDA